jgi:hypothetical protein
LNIATQLQEAQESVNALRVRADKAQDKINDKWNAKARRDENE